MQERTAGVVPVRHQIADTLRARIRSGELQPGDPIPTVRELIQEWDCSSVTARNAIAVLRSEGLVTGGRGVAYTVRKPPRRIKLVPDGRQAQKDLVRRPEEERAKTGASELSAGIPLGQADFSAKYDSVEATEELAKEFGISEGSALLCRTYETIDRETRHRILWSVSYIPRSLIESNPDLLDETSEPWPGGHQHQLYTVGIEVDHFVNSVIAIEPTPGERQKWGMESGVPMLRLRSRTVDTNDHVVEISDSEYPADRTEIFFTDQLTKW